MIHYDAVFECFFSRGIYSGRLLYRCFRHGCGHIGAEFVVLLVAAYDIALRIKKYDAWYSGDTVEIGRNILAIEDLRPGQFMLLYGAECVGRFVPYGYAKHVKAFWPYSS